MEAGHAALLPLLSVPMAMSVMSVSLYPAQDQDLSTVSPAIIFKSMFHSADDAAVQEDAQQTGLLTMSALGRKHTCMDTWSDRDSEILPAGFL